MTIWLAAASLRDRNTIDRMQPQSVKNYFISPPVFIAALAVILFFAGCKKDEPLPVDAGYNYFPDQVGHWCIYEVDSTVYDDFDHDTDSYRYQVKELIESYYTDNEGRQAMRVERYKRSYIDTVPYDSLPWTISRVWTFVRTDMHAEKVEENQRFIRLVFVPREGKSWNGNAYNTIGPWEYEYDEVDVPYSLNGTSFDSTLKVIQRDEKNLLEWSVYSERYARNIGLIEKNVIEVRDTTLTPGVLVIDRIYSGVIYTIKLVDWGPQ
ncbi:MAG TPA: hypothetical protein VI731_04635 [Bacteroidia bacterium]|nr:hypothetical protein [Bacteroidia bacterium]